MLGLAVTALLAYGVAARFYQLFPYREAQLLVRSLRGVAGTSESAGQGSLTPAERERLEALGYVTWAELDDGEVARSGVVRHDATAASPGINYYCSEPSDVAQFIDMQGKVIHSLEVVAPDPFFEDNRCKLIEPYDADSVLMLHEHTRITLLGFDSQPRWAVSGRYHHDLAVAGDGTIYALRDVRKRIPEIDPERWIMETEILALSPRGEILLRLPISPMIIGDPALLKQARSLAARGAKKSDAIDLFHVNTIEILSEPRRFGPGVELSSGDLLICIRNFDMIAVVDPRLGRIRWRWGVGELEGPHQPTLLQNGNLLIFDNGYRRGYSRIVELDPALEKIVWEFVEDPPESFFTRSRGGVEELANGNLLVTESMRGRVFEITRSGEIVWEFWNPELDEINKRRATIYRMMRFSPSELAAMALPDSIRQRLPEAAEITGP